MDIVDLDIETVNVDNPDPDILKSVLEDGLRKGGFTETTLEWVTCPNLTKKPFDLAAPGICENTAVLNFEDLPSYNKIYNINNALKKIINNFNNKQMFIFGDGVSFRPSEDVSERGTAFLCQGTQSDVLKIYAKANTSIVKSPKDFIIMMQTEMKEKFGKYGTNIVLGGIFQVCTRFGWKHLITQCDSHGSFTDYRNVYCNVKTIESFTTIFNSNPELPTPHCPGSSSKEPNLIYSTHCLSHQNADVIHKFYVKNDVVEFTGYFNPAQKLHRVANTII